MSTSDTRTVVSTPILGLLGIAFIVLKLTGVIAWSWWWVTAPFWIPLGLAFAILAIVLILVWAGVVKLPVGPVKR